MIDEKPAGDKRVGVGEPRDASSPGGAGHSTGPVPIHPLSLGSMPAVPEGSYLPSDTELHPLIERMALGDTDALTEYVRAVGPWLHAALLRITGSTVAAGVLLERSLEELWVQAPLYDAYLGPPLAWTFQVARLHGMSWLERRRGKEGRLKTRSDAGEVLSRDRSQADLRVVSALAMLPRVQAEALETAWFEGVPGGELGKVQLDRIREALPNFVEALLKQAPGTVASVPSTADTTGHGSE